jgi:hypothetical protein
VHYTIKHTIETDVDTFWKSLFFNEEFNRAFYVDYLEFTKYEVLEARTDPDGTVHRRVDCTPKLELPAPVRKFFGGDVGFIEAGRYDPKAKKYFVQALPRMVPDRIKTSSEVWVEPAGDKRCERIVTIDNTVKAFGLGTLIEGFIEQQTRELYQHMTEFTNHWIREQKL